MSLSTTCGCLAATRRLSRDDQTDDDEVTSNPLLRQTSSPSSTSFFSNPTPTPGPGSYPISPSSTSQAAAASSPSAALLHGRALTTHWARLSTTCPSSALHLASPIILRYMVTALRSITVKYEAHLWQMVFNATTASAPPLPLIPGLAAAAAAAGLPGAATAGHIGIYRLEQDETQILLQEALRTSIEELGSLLSEIQRRVVMIRAAAAGNSGYYSASGGTSSGLMMNQTATSTGNGLFAGSSSGLNLDGDIDMDTNMGTMDGDLEEELRGPPPTDEEMSEINMRLYQCLRRLEFLENGEVGKDARW